MPPARHTLSPEATTSALTLALEVFEKWRAGGVVLMDKSGITVDGIPFSAVGSAPGETLNGGDALVAAQQNIFQFDGKKHWTFQFAGKRVIKKKEGGFHHIQMLLKAPYDLVDCKVLVASINCHNLNCMKPGQMLAHNEGQGSTPSPIVNAADAVPVDQMVDQTTLQQVRNQLKSLQAELASHQESDNQVAAREAAAEIQALQKYLKDSCNRKRSKSFDGGVNNNRKKVWAAINRAIKSIEEDHPALAQHLKNFIKTGFSCCYAPEKQTEWVL